MRKVTKLVELKLVGLDGNAFCLMGAFKEAARKQGTPKAEIDDVINDCMSSDYNHLLQVLMSNTAIKANEEVWNETPICN